MPIEVTVEETAVSVAANAFKGISKQEIDVDNIATSNAFAKRFFFFIEITFPSFHFCFLYYTVFATVFQLTLLTVMGWIFFLFPFIFLSLKYEKLSAGVMPRRDCSMTCHFGDRNSKSPPIC